MARSQGLAALGLPMDVKAESPEAAAARVVSEMCGLPSYIDIQHGGECAGNGGCGTVVVLGRGHVPRVQRRRARDGKRIGAEASRGGWLTM
jgi:hypothetical protein